MRERERSNIDQLPPTPPGPRIRTHNLGLCSLTDNRSCHLWVYRMMLQPTEPHQPVWKSLFKWPLADTSLPAGLYGNFPNSADSATQAPWTSIGKNGVPVLSVPTTCSLGGSMEAPPTKPGVGEAAMSTPSLLYLKVGSSHWTCFPTAWPLPHPSAVTSIVTSPGECSSGLNLRSATLAWSFQSIIKPWAVTFFCYLCSSGQTLCPMNAEMACVFPKSSLAQSRGSRNTCREEDL